ncbi:hypothetical protein ACFC09_07400 [Streptomyces sp. NPDC056161]|uniref:hypothetical protein n=1 Tax=Streptomyces sp. NPDC056161 TaxID=3345732 RepID=UPI0035D7A908
MEPLFRLALLRPAIAQDPENPSVELSQQTDFQRALSVASSTPDPRPELRRVVGEYVAGPLFVGKPEQAPLAKETARFAATLDRLPALASARAAAAAVETRPGPAAPSPPSLRDTVIAAVRDAFGVAPADVVQSAPYKDAVARLRDSVLAIKYLPAEHTRPLEELVRRLRHLEIVSRLVTHTAFPAGPQELRRARRRPLRLPGATGLEPVLSTLQARRRQREKEAEAAGVRRARAEQLLSVYRQLRTAIGELTGLGGEHFSVSAQSESAEVLPPADYTPPAELARQISFHSRLAEANLRALGAGTGTGGGAVGGTSAEAAAEEPPPDPAQPTVVAGAAQLAGEVFGAKPDLLAGSPGFIPAVLKELSFRLGPNAAQQLSEATRTLLTARGIDVSAQPLDRIVALLQSEVDRTAAELEKLFGKPARRSVRRIGGTLVTTSTPLPSVWNAITVSELDPIEQIPLEGERVPATQGSVKPSGVADLLVVRQQLIGYEGADIAHIENVLKGETKLREHTRREETEQITVRETETTTSEERELESTDRFEMSRESSAVIKEDAALKAGLTVSGKYGPTVEFSASAEGSVSRSKEEATKSASDFSQDVTQRSAGKIAERVLERTSLRVTTEVTEKNTHTLDNHPGIEHISGVYQWVNKVYQAQMFNYGLRTMFDFMVPEPAAFLIHTLQSAHAGAVRLDKPPSFTLQANQVDETNYHYWVQAYQATDVTPPPEMYVTKSFDFKAGGGDSKTNYNHSGQITVDEGYQAFQGSVAYLCDVWESQHSLDVAVGRRTHRFGPGDSWVWITMLDEEQGSLPVAVDTFRLSQVAVAVEVKCRRTEHAMEKWRADTHAKLTIAYRARLAEYEEKLAALTLEAGVGIEGRNPQANQELIAHELRKNCVSILTAQHFDLFDALDIGADGIPQIDVDEAAAEGAYVRFFEQVFEWEHMTWVAYPYFWGRKSQWDERLAYDDPDPLFNQFLKAGYCRVTVPARLGFEGAVDHFMNFGELWNGGPLPTVSSPLYLPIADEIAERLDRPGDEIPQGEPWTVRIPTSLVRLRADDRLPRWVQNAQGEWVED